MTDPEDALRAGLHDPALDEGVSPSALLAGVRTRQERLLRRRQHVRTLAAAAAAVLVVGGAAVVTARAPQTAPARQPTPVAPAPTAPAVPPLPPTVAPTPVPSSPPTAVTPPVSTSTLVPLPSRGPKEGVKPSPLPEPRKIGDRPAQTKGPEPSHP